MCFLLIPDTLYLTAASHLWMAINWHSCVEIIDGNDNIGSVYYFSNLCKEWVAGHFFGKMKCSNANLLLAIMMRKKTSFRMRGVTLPYYNCQQKSKKYIQPSGQLILAGRKTLTPSSNTSRPVKGTFVQTIASIHY